MKEDVSKIRWYDYQFDMYMDEYDDFKGEVFRDVTFRLHCKVFRDFCIEKAPQFPLQCFIIIR